MFSQNGNAKIPRAKGYVLTCTPDPQTTSSVTELSKHNTLTWQIEKVILLWESHVFPLWKMINMDAFHASF